MSCSSQDLKAYLLGEIAQRDKTAVDDHLRTCQNCREELARLNATHTALLACADEELPQRIAFVSDQIFEPRWWQTIWRSGPAMGFAASAVLAAAILVHAFTRPAAAPPSVAPAVDTAKLEQRIQQELNARVQQVVAQAVRETEARQGAKFAKVLDAAEKRYELQRRMDMATLQQTVRYYDQQMGRFMVASNAIGSSGQ